MLISQFAVEIKIINVKEIAIVTKYASNKPRIIENTAKVT